MLPRWSKQPRSKHTEGQSLVFVFCATICSLHTMDGDSPSRVKSQKSDALKRRCVQRFVCEQHVVRISSCCPFHRIVCSVWFLSSLTAHSDSYCTGPTNGEAIEAMKKECRCSCINHCSTVFFLTRFLQIIKSSQPTSFKLCRTPIAVCVLTSNHLRPETHTPGIARSLVRSLACLVQKHLPTRTCMKYVHARATESACGAVHHAAQSLFRTIAKGRREVRFQSSLEVQNKKVASRFCRFWSCACVDPLACVRLTHASCETQCQQ